MHFKWQIVLHWTQFQIGCLGETLTKQMMHSHQINFGGLTSFLMLKSEGKEM